MLDDDDDGDKVDVDAQVESEDGQQVELEVLHDWDVSETMVETPKYIIDIKTLEKQKDSKDHKISIKNDKVPSMSSKNNKPPKTSENSQNEHQVKIEQNTPKIETNLADNSSQSLRDLHREGSDPVPAIKKFGPISNIVHIMISVDSLYNTQ